MQRSSSCNDVKEGMFVKRRTPLFQIQAPEVRGDAETLGKEEKRERKPVSPKSRNFNDENVEDPYNDGLSYYVKGDYLSSLKYFVIAADKEHPDAKRMIADVQNKIGIQKVDQQEFKDARLWFTLSYKNGNSSGCYNLGVMAAKGHETEKKLDEAKEFFLEADERKHPKAKKALGKVFYKEGTQFFKMKEYVLALKALKEAQKKGHPKAHECIGRVLNELGEIFYKQGDVNNSFSCFDKAAMCGNIKAIIARYTLFKTTQPH